MGEDSEGVANTRGIPFVLDHPQEDRKWAASELAELSRNSRKCNPTVQRSGEPPGKPLASRRCWLKGHWQGFGRGGTDARGTLDCLNCTGKQRCCACRMLWTGQEGERQEGGPCGGGACPRAGGIKAQLYA